MNTLMFLAARILHIVMAALWIGSTVFISVMLAPAVDASGASGGQVMASITRRGFHTYMAILASTTVVTGLYLFWRFTGGFDPEVAATHAGVAFAFGGAAGVLALIVGGGIVGTSGRKVVDVMGRVAVMTDGPAKEALVSQAAAARRRLSVGSKAVIGLQTFAIVCMAVAHYI